MANRVLAGLAFLPFFAKSGEANALKDLLDSPACDNISPGDHLLSACVARTVARSQAPEPERPWALSSYAGKFRELEDRNLTGYSETPLGRALIALANAVTAFDKDFLNELSGLCDKFCLSGQYDSVPETAMLYDGPMVFPPTEGFVTTESLGTFFKSLTRIASSVPGFNRLMSEPSPFADSMWEIFDQISNELSASGLLPVPLSCQALRDLVTYNWGSHGGTIARGGKCLLSYLMAHMAWRQHVGDSLQKARFRCDLGLNHEYVISNILKALLKDDPSRTTVRMVELGVHEATHALRILDEVPELEWMGVDPYPDPPLRHTPGGGEENGPWEDDDRVGASFIKAARISLKLLRFKGRATLLRHTAEQSLAWIANNSLDVVFLDYGSQTRTELTPWIHKLRPGGFMVGHDYWFAPRLLGALANMEEYPAADGFLNLAPDYTFFWQPGVPTLAPTEPPTPPA